MWLTVCPQDKTQRILAGNSASWQDIDEIEEQFSTVTLRSATHEGGDDRTWERLVFPDVLSVGVKDKAVLYGSEHWQMGLPLVSGHCYVQAWYSAMSKALAAWASPQPQRGDTTRATEEALARVACLLECALTVTIHARECTTDMELGLFSPAINSRATRSLRSQRRPCSSSSRRWLAPRGKPPHLFA